MERMVKKTGLIFLIICLLSGCGRKEIIDEKSVVQGVEKSINLYTAGNYQIIGDRIYYTAAKDFDIHVSDMQGNDIEQIVVDADREIADVNLNPDGNQGELLILGYYEGVLYCYRNAKNTILTLNTDSKESEVFAQSSCYIVSACIGEKGILSLGYDEGGKKVLQFIDRDVREAKRLFVPNLTSLTASHSQFWVLYENEEGQSEVAQYCVESNELCNVVSLETTDKISDFTYSEAEQCFYGYLMECGEFVRFFLDEPGVFARFKVGNRQASMYSLKSMEDSLWFWDILNGELCMFYPGEFVVNNRPFKVLMLENSEFSGFLGYQVEVEKLSWEEMSLRILAQDVDYDFIVINSELAEALSLRDSSAYLGLQGEGIDLFYEKCFPYLQEAGYYQGEIWMLPVHVYLPSLVYRKDNLSKYKLSDKDLGSMEGLIHVAEVLQKNGEQGKYELAPFAGNFPVKYIRNSQKNGDVTFDTPIFRDALEYLREKKDNDAFQSYVNLDMSLYSDYLKQDIPIEEMEAYIWADFLSKIYVKQEYGRVWDYEKYGQEKGFGAVPMPELFETDCNYVTADLLIVNAASERKDEIMDYINSLAGELIESPEHFLTGDRDKYPGSSLYDDLYAISEKAGLLYGIPNDLLVSYYDYFWGSEEDMEKVISNLDEKVRMYLCE